VTTNLMRTLIRFVVSDKFQKDENTFKTLRMK
jgi:hypothetical protein